MAEEKKQKEPNITAADFWRIWVQIHFPGNVALMSDPEIFAASFMISGSRPDKFFVEAWIDAQKIAFAGRADMFSMTEAEIALDNAEKLKAAGIKLPIKVKDASVAPIPAADFVAPVVQG
jgi:hypothetical protein